MGSFNTAQKLTTAYIEEMQKLFKERVFAISVVERPGKIVEITLCVATPDYASFRAYSFTFDFSEVTYRTLREEVCAIQQQTIDEGLVQKHQLLDVNKAEDILKILAVIETQLLTYIPAGWRTIRYFIAQQLKLTLWSSNPFEPSVQLKASELLRILDAAS